MITSSRWQCLLQCRMCCAHPSSACALLCIFPKHIIHSCPAPGPEMAQLLSSADIVYRLAGLGWDTRLAAVHCTPHQSSTSPLCIAPEECTSPLCVQSQPLLHPHANIAACMQYVHDACALQSTIVYRLTCGGPLHTKTPLMAHSTFRNPQLGVEGRSDSNIVLRSPQHAASAIYASNCSMQQLCIEAVEPGVHIVNPCTNLILCASVSIPASCSAGNVCNPRTLSSTHNLLITIWHSRPAKDKTVYSTYTTGLLQW